MSERISIRIGSLGFVIVGIIATLALIVTMLIMGYDTLMAPMFAGSGLAVIAMIAASMLNAPDDLQSQATERILRTTSNTLIHMREGLTSESCQATCLLLLPETQATAIAMTDTDYTLAYVGEEISLGELNVPIGQQVREVLESGKMQTLVGIRKNEWEEVANLRREAARVDSHVARCPVSVILPLVISGRAVGTLRLYYRHGREVDRTQMAIIKGLADLLSTQLTVSELDRQAELASQAEIRALQAQINPHFLFNTLNTMASLTRTDPTRARELLREFATFYRGTLETSQQQIPLATELEQTERYLRIEKARFGEDRIIDSKSMEAGCEDVRVPGFIIQPIVENAVRHAMRDDRPLHIDMKAVTDGNDLLISVTDDGLGMDEETVARMLDGSAWDVSHESKGTGVALHNVAERIELSYGAGSGVEVSSKLGEGTCVTLRLADAAPLDVDDE